MNVSMRGMNAWILQQQDKHREWDREHYRSDIEQENAYRSFRILCQVVSFKNHKTEQERTKSRIHNINTPDNRKLTCKQMHKKKQQDKQDNEIKDRIRHQQPLEYLHEWNPSHAEEP